ncbi:MAG TPA: hypothetical protein PKW35_09285 [Nannocystaceae bacterium]|nr:hypothetical protein [Nannocystaceae bacterium]
MSYYRDRFTSFEEFKRESFHTWADDLGKDEIELLKDLDDDDRFDRRPRRRRSQWD